MQKWMLDFLIKEYNAGKEITPFFLDVKFGITFHKAKPIVAEFEREYASKHPRKPPDEDPFR